MVLKQVVEAIENETALEEGEPNATVNETVVREQRELDRFSTTSTTSSKKAGRDITGDHETVNLLVGPDSDQIPVLSMVMLSLNGENGVAECIERAKTASHVGILAEIILSDSSTDRTPEIGQEFR